MQIKTRYYQPEDELALINKGQTPLMARLLAARGVRAAEVTDYSLKYLMPPNELTHSHKMAGLLADAILQKKRILIIGDYDADGATATAVAMKGLSAMGAIVDFLVPNRFEYGYGLTPEIVALAKTENPDILLTVDNGIASVDGVAYANKLGMQVLITDHHLPGDTTPDAACIVNPNQRGCTFKCKNLAGVGVMFYVLLALRATLRQRDLYDESSTFNLADLLDLVALGTVADLVKLDSNNRILVDQGLKRIRAGVACAGIQAIFKVAGKAETQATTQDLGFYVGPRLNAAGRLDDMTLGIRCLLANNIEEALRYAEQLQSLNMARREIEEEMQKTALAALNVNFSGETVSEHDYTICLYEPDWHQGVIGILASRIKEKYHRPVIAFADAGDGVLKGSGRSIQGLHLRDALDIVTKQYPNLILKFGGHAMAAGLSIKQADLKVFQETFDYVVKGLISQEDLQASLETDGPLAISEMTLDTVEMLDKQVWGQGFLPPLFYDQFIVIKQRILGEKHLKLSLSKQGVEFEAIFFNCAEILPSTVNLVYQLQANDFNGNRNLQLFIKYADIDQKFVM